MKMDELVKVSQSMVVKFTYKGSFESLPPCGNDGDVIFCNEKKLCLYRCRMGNDRGM